MRQLQALLAQIPFGRVTTYAEIAKALGNKKACRAAGTLLGKNPAPDLYPCCKVVKSNGHIGGFALGQADKIRRLAAEDIAVKDNRIIDFDKRFFKF